MNVVRVSKVRLYPNVLQEVTLLETLRVCKDAWNTLKSLIQDEYERTGKTLTYYDLCSKVVILKQLESKYQKLYAQVLRDVATRLINAYKTFFDLHKKGYKARLPRYKTLEHYHSFTYPQFGFKFIDNRIQLSKIGSIKYKGVIPENGIKTFTVKQSKSGKWFGYIVYEKQLDSFDADLPVVGIDLGLEKFATLSDGNYIPVPQFYRKDEKRIKKSHKELSRKKRGSKNRKRAKQRLARIYEKVNNRRLNFLHKTSTWVADHYSVVCVEDLRIANMAKYGYLGKSIHDASWGRFLALLEYKLDERNGLLVKVDPRNTSQTCSNCGEKINKTLNTRTHTCFNCGLVMDRDLNASRNILKVGIDDAELTPAESDTSATDLSAVSVFYETGISYPTGE